MALQQVCFIIKLFLGLLNLHVTKETKSILLMEHACMVVG